MKLKVKFLKWSAGIPAAMLNQKTASKIGVHIKERILIQTLSKNPKEMSAIFDTVRGIVGEKEIAVSSEIRKHMNLKAYQKVKVILASDPTSTVFIKKKFGGQTLSEEEIGTIIEDITSNSLSEAEISLFVSAMYEKGMSLGETIYLIKAILKTGNKLNLKNKLIVDKHSIGGVAGRTTPIVVSICAAGGLIMPKTSSRAITSPAGTADALEAMAKVDFSMKELKKIIKKTGACIVWGGGLEMVPADSRIIQIEKQLKIDPESQLLASIMAKKLAVGSNYIVIDIPYGKSAKVNKSKAERLKKKFEYLGKHFKKKLKCLLSKSTGPLGNGIGPILEMEDVIKVLKREDSCHLLEKKSTDLAGALFELTGKAKKGKGPEMATKILDSGKAFKKFKEILKAQKGSLRRFKPAKYSKHVVAKKSGKITFMDNKKINDLARTAGCPADKSAGLYLHHHEEDRVKKGEKLLTIYAKSRIRLLRARLFYKMERPISIR